MMKQNSSLQAKPPTVIVIDKDVEIHDLLRGYFRPKGFGVICFAEPPSKSELISARERGPVFLLTDHAEIGDRYSDLVDLNVISIFGTTAQSSEERAAKNISFADLQGKLDALDQSSQASHAKGCNITLIGSSPTFLKAIETAKRVAPSSASIFISGESGTGKELFAKFIHSQSQQSKGAFVAINCSAIPEGLLESELFGHAKGAFTGALLNKVGLFEEAQNGTLFLDEIGDLSLTLQAKLLRVLQDKQIKRVGENHYRSINCRVISATHKDLPHEVFHNRFREDLFFRLIVIPLAIPPLRERKEDLLPLAEFFLRRFCRENGTVTKFLSQDSKEFILQNPWRGNVRELENAIERAVILSTKPEISLDTFAPLLAEGPEVSGAPSEDSNEDTFQMHCSTALPSLNEVTQKYIEYAVRRNHGARDKTAKDIGIDRKTLYKRMRTDQFPRSSPAEHSLV